MEVSDWFASMVAANSCTKSTNVTREIGSFWRYYKKLMIYHELLDLIYKQSFPNDAFLLAKTDI